MLKTQLKKCLETFGTAILRIIAAETFIQDKFQGLNRNNRNNLTSHI